MRHLTSETEVQIIQGTFTRDSLATLSELETEMEVLQYRERLGEILGPWQSVLGGQPVTPEIERLLGEFEGVIIADFEKFIYQLQDIAKKDRRTKDNLLCKNVCSSKPKILNLSESKVPAELEKALAHGSNFVPSESLSPSDLKSLIERDLISAAVNFFRDKNQIYPLVNAKAGLKTVLEQLISQSPSNSTQIEFFTTMYDTYHDHKNEFYDKLSEGHFIDHPTIQEVLPKGTILAEADKGLGPCLLPVEWYIDQYKVQSLKGNHVLTNMSNDQCINYLKLAIDTFRTGLSQEERQVLKKYFVNTNPNFRVGVLKLVPKIHKLTKFDSQSWKVLPSRPIRGAENCPINPYSQTLCRMLQEMHSLLKNAFSERAITFPVIYGCDEYSEKIHKVAIDRNVGTLTTLVSGDFSDAYTQSRLADLTGAIEQLGQVVSWPNSKVVLAQKLSKLVFENCFFETPSGILRQTQGFPMGGHSSREGLDNILLAGEFALLSKVKSDLLYYYRLVDDISLAVNGKFSMVKTLLNKMARAYPVAMPLNIQISFGYSHFLDSHVFNFLQPNQPYSLTTSLAYKPLSRFDYVPFNSNIAPAYKGNAMLRKQRFFLTFPLFSGCVVPSFLHRVFARCTDSKDVDHHVQFLRKILKNRNQNTKVIAGKFDTFFSKRLKVKDCISLGAMGTTRSGRSINVKFDGVSKMHLFSRSCIIAGYKASGTAKPRIIFSSLPRVVSRISTKRKVLAIVKKRIVSGQ